MDRKMDIKHWQRKILCLAFCVWLLSSPCVFANGREESLFYYQAWLQSLEIAQKTWEQWVVSAQNLNPSDWYLGGLIAYRQKDSKRALELFKKAMEIPCAPDWVKKASEKWCAFLTTSQVTISYDAKTPPRLLSELGVLAKESGNSRAWRLAHLALEQAKKRQEAKQQETMRDYWQNLCLTCPDDPALWRQAIDIVLEDKNQDTPLFDPGIFWSLFCFVKKFGFFAASPSQQKFVFVPEAPGELSPINLQTTLKSLNLTPLKAKYPLPWILEKHGSQLWELAWAYGERGFLWKAAENEKKARWYWQNSLSLYYFLFRPSQRGNLASFEGKRILQMSRVLLASEHYESMLFYIYRPSVSSLDKFRPISLYFRPSLQFLLASQLMKKEAKNVEAELTDPVELIFSDHLAFLGDAFLWAKTDKKKHLHSSNSSW
jgi:hypothetical protein